MASLITGQTGLRVIQFVAPNGRQRRTMRLGRMPKKQAEAVLQLVERLVSSAKLSGGIDTATAAMVRDLSEEMHNKFAAVGLVDPRAAATLAAFLDEYISHRGHLKPATHVVYGHTRRCLVEYFGAEMLLRRITAGDAEDWHHWLTTHEDLADNTVRRRTGLARQFFGAAIKKRLLDANPFEGLDSTVQGNADKFFFVTSELATKILDACPDAQWRLLFALARYGGLRCPSEHLALTWDDVHWEQDRVTVHAPKTERHPGKATRVIPMFPELRPYLEEVYDQAPEETVHVITRYRDKGVNLRTQLLRIIKKAGVEPWPKLWQNLRATRQTELEDTFPSHVVCQWVGNSPRVARKHYLHVTEEHYRAATNCSALQKALHQGATTGTNEQKGGGKKRTKPRENRGSVSGCHSLVDQEVGDTGLEPMTSAV